MSDRLIQMYRPAFAPLPAAWECDLATNRLSWAPGVYDLFGLPTSEPLHRDAIVAMYAPESRALLDRLRARAIAECGSFTFTAEIRRADGRRRWIRITADVEARGGRACRLYGLKRDISDEMLG